MISVVIPARNAARVLVDQLAALASEDVDTDWEVIVADNGSTDDTAEVVQRWHRHLPVRLVDASLRVGPAAARNIGASHACGDVLAFTDADDVVLPGWLAAANDIQGGPAFVTGPSRWFVDGKPISGRPATAARPFRHMKYLEYAGGTNFIVDRETFDVHGGFDEALITGEDVDLSWRLQLAGVTLMYDTRAQVAIRMRRSVRSTIRQYHAYGRGDVELYRRYASSGVPVPHPPAVAKSYFGLAARLPFLWNRQVRTRWAFQVGRRSGRLREAIRLRTPYL